MYWDTYDAAGTPWPKHMDDSFKAANPNVTVEYRPVPYTSSQLEAYPKMYAMYAAGTLGDVFNFDPSQWEFYRAIGRGILLPVDDLIKSDKFDLTQFYTPFVDLQRWQGKMWGLPNWGWSGFDGIFYNTVALQDAGITLPDQNSPDWTMDTIYQHAVKLNKVGSGGAIDRYGINLTWGPIGVVTIARSFNGDLLSPDGKKAAIADPNTTKALQWMYNLAQKDKVVALPGGFQGAITDLFASGKVGMFHGGSVQVFGINQTIKDPKLCQLKAMLLPKRADGKRASQMRAGSWNILSKSQQPGWAWEFIKHITSHDGMLTMNTEGGEGAYTRPDIMNDKWFQDPNFQVFVENLLTSIQAIVPANFRGTEYEDAFTQTLSGLYLGKVNFDAGVKQVNDAVQRVLDEPTG